MEFLLKLFHDDFKASKDRNNCTEKVIQADTVGAMQAGLYYGYTEMIDGIVAKLLKELNWKEEDTNIISTGGFSTMLTKDSKYNFIINKFLTLEGLKIIYEKNNKLEGID